MATQRRGRAPDHGIDGTWVAAALDGTDVDDAVVDWAADEAFRSGEALHLVHVLDTGMQFAPHEMLLGEAPSLAASLEEAGDVVVQRATTRATTRHPELVVDSVVEWGSPAGVLVRRSADARVLVVGSRPRGRIERAVLGSVALAVIHHGRPPVVVVPTGTDVGEPEHVVLGVDGSPASHRAAEFALSVAEGSGADVHCVVGWNVEVVDGTVVTEPGTPAWTTVQHRYDGVARRSLEDAVSRHPEVSVAVDVRHAEPSRALLGAADEVGADLLVVGSRGFGGFRGLLLGSVAKRVLEGASTVVAVVK
jgi:nucleotide-binding universal stress UspA family protein